MIFCSMGLEYRLTSRRLFRLQIGWHEHIYCLLWTAAHGRDVSQQWEGQPRKRS